MYHRELSVAFAFNGFSTHQGGRAWKEMHAPHGTDVSLYLNSSVPFLETKSSKNL